MKNVCVVTGTRAEYGLLKPVIKKIEEDSELVLKLLVTGSHLSNEFGATVQEIENDGVPIAKKVEMLLSADTASAITKSMGVEMIGIADYFQDETIDMVVVLGDRYEILVATIVATMFRIPIAHIHGGELTEGIVDEAIRHSITKMSVLHFPTTEMYRKRIIQLGEEPWRVQNVGSLGVESIHNLQLLDMKLLSQDLNILENAPIIVVTYHPVTLEQNSSQCQMRALLEVLSQLRDVQIIFTKANADMEGNVINQMIDSFVLEHSENSKAFYSLGQMRYLSLLQYASCVIGNSSSGIIEVPSFGIPTVNIGDRQKGRERAKSVIDCGVKRQEISQAIQYAMSEEGQKLAKDCQNPYDRKGSSDMIIKGIRKFLENGYGIEKHFYDIDSVN